MDARITVMLPGHLGRSDHAGPLHGYWHPASGAANIITCGPPTQRSRSAPPLQLLGWLGQPPAGAEPGIPGFQGSYDENGILHLIQAGQAAKLEYYSLHQDLFSRNTGILESTRMINKTAILVGCGSVGSLAALEMARAGVGTFMLIDHDRLQYHNLCRHQCGLSDVGRYKVAALADRILEINPEARIHTETRVIQQVPRESFDRYATAKSIFVGGGDNREADLYANRIACLYKVPLISVGLWERAFAGEIFYTLPGETPCYCCYCQTIGFSQARVNQNRRFYTNETDLAKTNFEPGISTDLSLVTLMATKMAYDLLNRRDRDTNSKVLHDLSQLTLVCNSTDPTAGGEMAYLFSHAFQVTRSIEVEKLKDCPHCKIVGAVLEK